MRHPDFEALVQRAQACRLCTSMEGRVRVLGQANGKSGAQVLFVGEDLLPERAGPDGAAGANARPWVRGAVDY